MFSLPHPTSTSGAGEQEGAAVFGRFLDVFYSGKHVVF